jgi:hypothetical protein
MRARLAHVLVAATVLAVVSVARPAGAYCRSASCEASGAGGSQQGEVCTPADPQDCGTPLQWRQPCVSFAIQQSASRQVSFAAAERVLTSAFATWMGVDCGGAGPSLQILDFGSVDCDEVQYNQHGGNANVLIFRDSAWPHDTGGGGVDTLALTTVTFDVGTGDVYDADIEVNTADNTFTTTDAPSMGDADLLAVLTHETGHFIGLAHSKLMGVTMYPSYDLGTIDIRTLQPDDVEAVCAAYPIGRDVEGACTGIPRHGFASECFAAQTYLGCEVTASAGAPTGMPARPRPLFGASALAGLLAIAAALRARRAGRRRSDAAHMGSASVRRAANHPSRPSASRR